ncbi:MAG TPA: DUF3857 domain-containing protein [Candidatus Dormibacteraeota bacterium]|nr:DUF3857 domain-containing protein [Candidatus Dormibacteraeota bacterium]
MKSNPLDPGAGAVVLFKRGEMDVLEQQGGFWTTRIRTYERIKVFNDAGRDAANISVEAFKNVRMSKVEGRTILPSGEIIPLDPSKVFRGKAYESGKNFAIMETSFTFPSVEPGAIIEYRIEEYVDWYFPPQWIFDTRGLGTLDSTLRVLIGPRLAMAQFPLDTTVSKISVAQSETVKGTQYDFTVKNLHPIQLEPFSLPYRDLATLVIFTPLEVGFSGQVFPIVKSWNDVATEITREFKGMSQKEQETKKKAAELVKNITDPKKKAEAIYQYIQQNIASSNVIGVYLGREADEILSAKRGDPDEINALFVIMLREAKVNTDMVLVATRNWESLATRFPNYSQFSRAITRLNFKDGAVFADPADPASPFGEVPWFDRGVLGLAVKGNNIQEAPIPEGSMDENISSEKTVMHVAKDWTAEGDEEIDMKGSEAIDFRADLMDESPDKVERRLTDYFAGGHSDSAVTQITHPDFRDSSQPFVLKAHVREKLTNEAGPGEFLLNPWATDEYEQPRFKTTVRHSAVRFDDSEKRISTSTWQFAPEIKVEQLPKAVKFDNAMGGFSHSCEQNGSTVTCTRTYYLKKTLLQTTLEYLNAKKFFDDIAKTDQEVILLRGQ